MLEQPLGPQLQLYRTGVERWSTAAQQAGHAASRKIGLSAPTAQSALRKHPRFLHTPHT